jgi:hypothetical protein
MLKKNVSRPPFEGRSANAERVRRSSSSSAEDSKEQTMGTGQAGKGMGNESSSGHRVGSADPATTDESDLAPQSQGNNQLQGNDQGKKHTERGAVAMERGDTEGVVESFEKIDPKRRP